MLTLLEAVRGLPAPACTPLLRVLAARPPFAHALRRRWNMHAAPALPRLAALSTASVGEAQPPAAEDFYASSAVSFSSLGLSAEVCSALAAAGFQRPAHAQVRRRRRRHRPALPACAALLAAAPLHSIALCLHTPPPSGNKTSRRPGVQELAVPAMLAGRDAVLAAETGSGKTLAYVVPLVELALRKRAEQQQKAEEEQQQQQLQQRQDGEFGGAAVAHPRLRFATAALVLCPNAALCEQVVGAARSLRDPATGAPLASAALVSGQSPPPLQVCSRAVPRGGAVAVGHSSCFVRCRARAVIPCCHHGAAASTDRGRGWQRPA